MTRICTKCHIRKPVSYFYIGKRGIRQSCKVCGNKAAMAWAKANPENVKISNERWRRKNAVHVAEQQKIRIERWQKNHPGVAAKRALQWYKDNTSWAHANSKMQHIARMNAVPKWANKFFMEEIYDLARLRTRVMGFQWHVDHIVSIKSPLVCGLHVENNLRVIPAIENLKKRNRWWPDMPEVICRP